MRVSTAAGNTRTTVFAPRIDELLQKYRGGGLFRLDEDTVGIADPELISAIKLKTTRTRRFAKTPRVRSTVAIKDRRR